MTDRRNFLRRVAGLMSAAAIGRVTATDSDKLVYEGSVRYRDNYLEVSRELPGSLEQFKEEAGFEDEDILSICNQHLIRNAQMHTRMAIRDGMSEEEAQRVFETFNYSRKPRPPKGYRP